MSEEDWVLRELGDMMRKGDELADDPLDERWERLSSGQLTADEEEELRALAAASPEARVAYEAFHPLGPTFQARMVDELAAELAKGAAPAVQPLKNRRKRGPVPRFRLPPSRPGSWLAAAAAVAATLATSLWLLLSGPGAIGEYVIADVVGDQQFRGRPVVSGLPAFTTGSHLEVCAVPKSPVDEKVEAHAYLARSDRRVLTPWEPKSGLPPSPSGGACLEGVVGADLPPPALGEWRVWIVIALQGDFPPLEELSTRLAEERGGSAHGRHWRAVSKQIAFRAPPAR